MTKENDFAFRLSYQYRYTYKKKIETIKIDLPLIESHINNTETTKQ